MAVNVELVQMSDTMTEGTLTTWLKHEGEAVRVGDAIAEVETDKAVMEMEAQEEGILLKAYVREGDTVPCGTVIAVIGQPGDSLPERKTPPAGAPAQEEGDIPTTPGPAPPDDRSSREARLRSSPAARKLARSAGVDLRAVSGSGPAGRIVRRDVEAALAPPSARPAEHVSASTLKPSAEPVPFSRIRRKMIARLVETHGTVPTFSLTRRICMDGARFFRAGLEATDAFREGVGFTEMLVKAVACAMRVVPALNAQYGESGIRLIEDVNVGVAVGLEDVVIVPVIRRCQARSLREIRDDYQRIISKAKTGNLLADDLGSSTFTVSNLGMYGVEEFTAILNAPDAAILAVGAITPQPVVRDGDVIVAEMMAVTLTVDHRVADGVLAARWLHAFADRMENPVSLLVE